VEGYPSPEELEQAEWVTIVPRSGIAGDADNFFEVTDSRRFTHVRLSIYPDGGVARFRVHGVPMPDPRLLTGTVDLAALEYGGDVVDCSDMFYSSPVQLLLPGRARIMGDGWENARRRDGGNDHVTVRLAARGQVRRVEIDTSYFVGNAAGWASLRGSDGDLDTWVELVPKTRLQPDTRHFFQVDAESPVTHVRLDVYPDGGLARLRINGEVAEEALLETTVRWFDALPEAHALQVLTSDGGLDPDEAEKLVAQRPFTGADEMTAGYGVLDDCLRRLLRLV
jgi:allantoicase